MPDEQKLEINAWPHQSGTVYAIQEDKIEA